jgi:hypothetical protein
MQTVKLTRDHIESLRKMLVDQAKVGSLFDLDVTLPAVEVQGLVDYIDELEKYSSVKNAYALIERIEVLEQQVETLKNPRVQDIDAD